MIAADDSTDQTTRDFGDASGFGFVNGFGSGANTTGQMVYADDILLPYQYYQSGGAIEEFTLSDGSSISNEAIVHGLAESRAYIAANEVYLAQIQADGRDAKGYVDQIILAKWHRQSRDILCSDADDAIVVGDGDDLVDAAGGNDTIAGGTEQMCCGVGQAMTATSTIAGTVVTPSWMPMATIPSCSVPVFGHPT
ncbi:hypothetical protein [Syntrophotalea acetylenica]|uniref:hypothetical protein n=1 Tax=Syntrophotalea acetylenica TaxID=29542 RepID=UPI000AFEC573|nr:hypothetical protein [Syntrophotalea acetylenica]